MERSLRHELLYLHVFIQSFFEHSLLLISTTHRGISVEEIWIKLNCSLMLFDHFVILTCLKEDIFLSPTGKWIERVEGNCSIGLSDSFGAPRSKSKIHGRKPENIQRIWIELHRPAEFSL